MIIEINSKAFPQRVVLHNREPCLRYVSSSFNKFGKNCALEQSHMFYFLLLLIYIVNLIIEINKKELLPRLVGR